MNDRIEAGVAERIIEIAVRLDTRLQGRTVLLTRKARE